MIGIDWLFIGGAGSIVGVALIERLAENYGINWLGSLLKLVLPIAGIIAGFTLFDAVWEVFLR